MKPSFNNNHNKNKKYMIWIIVLTSLVVLGAATYFVIKNPSILNNSSGSQIPNQESKENEGNNDLEPKEQSDVDSSNSENSPQKGDQTPEVVDDNGYIVGQPEATEPTYVDGVLIANKKYPLPKTFQPGEDVDARAAFELMAGDARKAGFEIVAFSTYRSYEYQQTLYNNYVERDGKENADRYSARPGYSEHQTGLAFDIGEVGREDLWLTSEFGETEAGKWLVNNAHKYGFILRYPQGKEKITGYMYESWHFRYLGIQLATDVKKSSLTLEEYLGIQ
ncbi:M15 family metallopeptidase [Ureibacillus composti]|nr:M15 family metallopeptidase [Ureibacillus composti]